MDKKSTPFCHGENNKSFKVILHTWVWLPAFISRVVTCLWSKKGNIWKRNFIVDHNFIFYQQWSSKMSLILIFILWFDPSQNNSSGSVPQFYIQLLYRPLFGTWNLPFGLLGSKMKISEMTEFLLKYATFWGVFFMFSRTKNLFIHLFFHILASALKSCII